MRRFQPDRRNLSLHNKVRETLAEQRFLQGGNRLFTKAAPVFGMDAEAREAWEKITELAASGRTAVAGAFMPDAGLSARLAAVGVVENISPDEARNFRNVVIPFTGMTVGARKNWKDAGVSLTDFTAPQIRRAQTALSLSKLDGSRGVVIGMHGDAEAITLASFARDAVVIEDTTDTARLPFSPSFGVVCQTTLSPRKADWLHQQFRMRWRDAKVQYTNTTTPAMRSREEAMEQNLDDCDIVLIVGDKLEASVRALGETALRKNKPYYVIEEPEEVEMLPFPAARKALLTAGAFTHDDAIQRVAARLVRMA